MNQAYTIEAVLKASGAEQFSRNMKQVADNIGLVDEHSEKSSGGIKNMVGSIGKIAGAIGITKLVGKGFDMISSSVGSAVNRFDTLQNSQKVFENMGFGAEEASAMMDNLVDSVTGLPTPMEDAVQGVQRLSSATGDLEGSEKIYSALNNGVLAFGGSNEDVNRTVEMMSRGLQKGTIDGQEFNSLMANMGPVINAVAEEMGYTTDQLQKGLSDGSISVDDFTDSLLDMNENGGAGMASLEQQARDMTGGIGTSIENVQNAINRGMATIIEKTNEALEKNGLPNIAEMVQIVGQKMEQGLKVAAESIEPLILFFMDLVEVMGKVQEAGKAMMDLLIPEFGLLVDAVKEVWEAIKTSFSEGNFQEVASLFGTMIDMIIEDVSYGLPYLMEAGLEIISNIIDGVTTKIPEFLQTGLEMMVMFASILADIIPKLLRLGADFVISLLNGIANKYPEWIAKAVDMVVKMAGTLGDNLPKLIQKGSELLSGIARGFRDKFPEIVSTVFRMITTMLTEIARNLPQLLIAGGKLILKLVAGIIKSIPDVTRAMGDITKGVVNAVSNIDLWGAGKAIIDGFLGGLRSTWDKGKGFITGIGGWIAKNKGPISYDKKLLTPAGKAIINGLNKGLQDTFPEVQKTIRDIAGAINGTMLASPTIDISGSVARSHASVNQSVDHSIYDKRGDTQPVIHVQNTLNIGGHEFKDFVEMISSEQGRITDLEMQF